MPSDAITIRTRLLGAKAAAAEARAVGKGVGGIGTAAGRAEAKSRRFGRTHIGISKSMGKVRGSAFGAAKGVLALGAAYVGASGIKSSVDTTEELARSTISLHKNLGLSVEKASEWAAVARSRDIDTKALNMSFGTLSKNIEGASKAGSTQAQIFDKLGVSQKTVASGDFNAVLGETADRLKAMGPGAERTALTMKLFGRGWQTVVPLLRDGSGEMRAQLALARKYGATFHGHTIKSLNEFIQAQRESKIATMGLQIAVGTTLIPVLTKALGVFSRFVHQMRTGKGAGGQFAHTAKQIWQNVKPVVLWAGRAAVNIAKFAAKHATLAKVAASLWLAQRALKAMKFFSAIQGAQTLFSWLGKDNARVKRMPETAKATRGSWISAGGMLGKVFGAAMFVAFAAEFGPKIANWLHDNVPSVGGGPGSHNLPWDPKNKLSPFQKGGHGPPGGGSWDDYFRRQQRHKVPPLKGTTGGPHGAPRVPRAGRRALLPPQMPVGAAAGGGDIVVPVTVMTPDNKVLGHAVARATRDDANRR